MLRVLVPGGLLLLLLTSPAAAQDRSLETAKQFFDEGQNLYVQGKYGDAAEQFQKAYDAKPYPAFLFNIAVCHEKNRDYVKALSYYERYLKDDPHTTDRATVLKRIAAIREHLAPSATSQPSSQPAPPPTLPTVTTKGLVVIESKPEGAAIYLGDKRRGIFTRTPYTGNLNQGEHTVIVELRKFKPERKTFYVRSDRMVYLYFALSAEEYLGWIEVKANVPGADVFFDQRKVGAVGRTPYTGFLRPGKRTLIVEKPGYTPVERTLDVSAGKDHVVNLDLERVKFGWLRVTGKTTEGATVKVNGKPLACPEYPCKAELDPGSYSVEVRRKGFKPYKETVTVQQATESQLAVRLMPRPPRTKAYVSFGISGALLVGGIVAGVLSVKRGDSLAADAAAGRVYDSGDSRLTEGRIMAVSADVLFGLATITGGLGLYYMFRNEGPDSYGETRTNKIAVTPLVSPSMAGLAGQVRF